MRDSERCAQWDKKWAGWTYGGGSSQTWRTIPGLLGVCGMNVETVAWAVLLVVVGDAVIGNVKMESLASVGYT